MKKKITATKPTAPAKPDSLVPLIAEVRQLIHSARRGVASVVDTFQVMTNFEIGRRIVEHEQKGEKRAAYGAELLKELSARLTAEFGKGFSVTNLKLMRLFFVSFAPRIGQSVTDQFESKAKSQSPTDLLALPNGIWQTPSAKLASKDISQTPSGKFTNPFKLSWTHYVELLGIKDPDERSFYEIESASSGWSVREQIGRAHV